MKCSKVGCDKEGYPYSYPVFSGAFIAQAYFCPDHVDEGLKELIEVK